MKLLKSVLLTIIIIDNVHSAQLKPLIINTSSGPYTLSEQENEMLRHSATNLEKVLSQQATADYLTINNNHRITKLAIGQTLRLLSNGNRTSTLIETGNDAKIALLATTTRALGLLGLNKTIHHSWPWKVQLNAWEHVLLPHEDLHTLIKQSTVIAHQLAVNTRPDNQDLATYLALRRERLADRNDNYNDGDNNTINLDLLNIPSINKPFFEQWLTWIKRFHADTDSGQENGAVQRTNSDVIDDLFATQAPDFIGHCIGLSDALDVIALRDACMASNAGSVDWYNTSPYFSIKETDRGQILDETFHLISTGISTFFSGWDIQELKNIEPYNALWNCQGTALFILADKKNIIYHPSTKYHMFVREDYIHSACAWSPDGQILACANCYSPKITVLDTLCHTQQTYLANGYRVWSIIVDNESNALYTLLSHQGTNDLGIYECNKKYANPIKLQCLNNVSNATLAWHPSKPIFAVATTNKIYLIDNASKTILKTIAFKEPLLSMVYQLSINPYCSQFAIAGLHINGLKDHSYLYLVNEKGYSQTVDSYLFNLGNAYFSTDGQQLYYTNLENAARCCFDIEKQERRPVLDAIPYSRHQFIACNKNSPLAFSDDKSIVIRLSDQEQYNYLHTKLTLAHLALLASINPTVVNPPIPSIDKYYDNIKFPHSLNQVIVYDIIDTFLRKKGIIRSIEPVNLK